MATEAVTLGWGIPTHFLVGAGMLTIRFGPAETVLVFVPSSGSRLADKDLIHVPDLNFKSFLSSYNRPWFERKTFAVADNSVSLSSARTEANGTRVMVYLPKLSVFILYSADW